MSNDQAMTWATEADRKRDLRRRKIAEAKHRAYMFGHKIFWRTLWFTRLAVPYSKTLCRLGLYSKYPDGRCHWCGTVHTAIPEAKVKE